MTYEEAKAIADQLNAASTESGRACQEFPRDAMGLVSDEVRATPEYKLAYAKASHDFARLRAFNGIYVKTFKKEIAAARNAKYAALSKV